MEARQILGRGWSIFRSWPLWVQAVVVVVVFGLTTGAFSSDSDDAAPSDRAGEAANVADDGEEESSEPDSAADANDEEDPRRDPRCIRVAKELLRQIEFGLTTDGKGRLRNEAFAVRSDDYSKVWMVAAELDAPGLEGVGDIAVWGTNEDPSRRTSSGLIIRANSMAEEFSDWGAAAEEGSAADLNSTDDGVAEAEACVTDALTS